MYSLQKEKEKRKLIFVIFIFYIEWDFNCTRPSIGQSTPWTGRQYTEGLLCKPNLIINIQLIKSLVAKHQITTIPKKPNKLKEPNVFDA